MECSCRSNNGCIATLASLTVLAAFTAGCGQHNTTGASIGAPGQPERALTGESLVETLFKPEARPENVFFYLDVSPSAFPELLKQSDDLLGRAAGFLTRAAPGSVCEVSMTGTAPGHPVTLLSATVPRAANPAQRKTFAATTITELRQALEQLRKNPPRPSGSFLIEDLRRLAGRGANLPGPCHLIAYTDGGFFSLAFRAGEVLRSPKPEAPEVMARITRRLPRMARPPVSFTLVYLAPRAEEGAQVGDEPERLTRFLRGVLIAWGTPERAAHITEPAPLRVGRP